MCLIKQLFQSAVVFPHNEYNPLFKYTIRTYTWYRLLNVLDYKVQLNNFRINSFLKCSGTGLIRMLANLSEEQYRGFKTSFHPMTNEDFTQFILLARVTTKNRSVEKGRRLMREALVLFKLRILLDIFQL